LREKSLFTLVSEGAVVLYSLNKPFFIEASSGDSFFCGIVGGLRTIVD
jgi:hypothetical protein